MKTTLIFALISLSLGAQAATIPMTQDDQSKLENLLRRIPGTQDRAETKEDKQIKFSSFLGGQFTINCEASYYLSSPIPSEKSCKVDVKNETSLAGSEYVLNIKDAKVVARLFDGIPEGKETKKLYSTERIGSIFRYVFLCTKESCKITFANLPLSN